MTFGSILGTFFISPLKLIFEFIFQIVYGFIQNPGVCIIFLSLAMNFLVLPLYKRADAMQTQARDTEARLKPGIDHIKKTFSGNERMMMLQTFYRQNDYSPANALHGSVSLLLEIPFFMAAYQFLSNLELLKGVSFGPIADLSVPDGLISIGGLSINLLPVLMTLINFISSAIYLKGFPLKTKVQIYGIAVVFLVFLYGSPSGLVFYWTLNNVFSLVKNIVFRFVKPKEKKAEKPARTWEPNRKLFIGSALFLTVLIGVLIPSNYIAASPQEYVDVTSYFDPLWYVLSAFLLAAGTFMLWFGVFYWLAKPKGKVIFERVLWAFCGVAIVSYMVYGSRFGMVSSTLRYSNVMQFTFREGLINVLLLGAAAGIMLFLGRLFKKLPGAVLTVAVAAMVIMSGINIVNTARSVGEVRLGQRDDAPHFALSKNGKNVVVMFLDRAMGLYVPYMVEEKPELKDLFDGFTYYSNVISFGGHTNFGAPALMGGYEYTPVELNKRDGELLKDKHNESLKVMPVMFLKEGYNVTVCDAPYANYKWIPDMSIYDDYEGINTYITKGFFGSEEDKKTVISRNLRNFYCFALSKTLPLPIEAVLYDGGNYLQAGENTGVFQICLSNSRSRGMSEAFMNSYEVIENLGFMTRVTDDAENNYLFFYNDAPHEPMMLSEPDYRPAATVDNTEYDLSHAGRFTLGTRTLKMNTAEQIMHYQSNMAVLLSIGNWLDYLREKGVYDNTKIIIVADHGYYLYHSDELMHRTPGGYRLDIGNYFPLLMVKDFGEHGFKMSDEFMTNADVPAMAADGAIKDPVNPFTGKKIDSSEKTAHDQFIITSRDWGVDSNNGNTFKASGWAAVTDDIWDRKDWRYIEEKIVLKENEIPEGKESK